MNLNLEKIAKPAVIFIIFGVLKGYLKKPLRFMIGTIITFPSFKKSIDFDLPKEAIASYSFIVHLYKRLQKRFSKEKAFEITRAAVLCSSLSVMQANFRNVEVSRTYENLIKYQQKAKEQGVTKLNEMVIKSQTEDCYEYCVIKCIFFEFFNYMQVPEITTIFCAADNAIFNTYLPNKIVFERGINETLPEGAKQCSFCIRKRCG